MAKSLNKMIADFLKDRRRSPNGGWAEVTEDDVKQLNGIIYKLIERKCEKDSDGFLPITVRMVNRRKRYFAVDCTMPYEPSTADLVTLAATVDSGAGLLSRLLQLKLNEEKDAEKKTK